jgi:signal transduction histidine kinase
VTVLTDEEDGTWGTLNLARDTSQRRLLEMQLHQAQKLESIGQLAAGIAHEINTPMQYVGDNTQFLRKATGALVAFHQRACEMIARHSHGEAGARLVQEFEEVAKSARIDFLAREIPRAIEQSLEGISRVSQIVRSMKEFSHPGLEEKTPTDLNHAIENTVTVARNEWKYVAELETALDLSLPLVPLLIGDFNQVILNLIINSAHAIADVIGDASQEKGLINISTQQDGDSVVIRVSDTGGGIPEKVRGQIFDPFFTTKAVGKGTGQGLAIAHAAIVKRHGGTITFDTEMGRGTTFVIRLPLNGEAASEQEQEA